MFFLNPLHRLLWAFAAISTCSAKLLWGDTKFLITFGDSYTTDGFNISAGVDSPVPGFVSSNGPNWVQQLGTTYNVAGTKIFNLASGGATIDAKLVTPFEPTVLSIVDQVAQFKTFLAPRPAIAPWSSNNTLFAIWIGINDVGNSFGWTNITQSAFNTVLMNRLESQLEILHQNGARSFLFLTVPPTNRAPLIIQQGPSAVKSITADLANYNAQLRATTLKFQAKHRDIETVTVFDTQPVFNTLLDNAKTFGFVNITGFCDSYQNGTPSMTTQIAPCAPVDNYFWLNSLHPLFSVHNSLALAISSTLSSQ